MGPAQVNGVTADILLQIPGGDPKNAGERTAWPSACATPDKTATSAEHSETNGGLQPDAPPFFPGVQGTPSGAHASAGLLQPNGDWVHQTNSTPPGMDRDAYAAGERAAMGQALQMMLPSQQTLGMLASGLQRIEQRVHEESAHARQSQLVAADVRALAQTLHHRLDQLECVRLPGMETRIQHALEAPLSQEFQATLTGLQDALSGVGARSGYGPYSLTGFAIRQLSWLGATASLYTQKALSKADVAAIFLSRKILLDNKVAGLIGPSQAGEASELSPSSKSTRAVVGAALFLVAVEAAWQMHVRALNYMPPRLRKATAPAQLGLRILRGATWAATLTLSAVYFRRGCYVVADQSISQIDRALKQLYAFRPFSGPTVTLPPEVTDPEEGGISSPFQEQSQEAGPQEQQLYKSPTAPVVPLRQRSIFDTPPPSPPP